MRARSMTSQRRNSWPSHLVSLAIAALGLLLLIGCTGQVPDAPIDGPNAQVDPSVESQASDAGVTVRIPTGQVRGKGELRLDTAGAVIPTLELIAETSSPITVTLAGTTLVGHAELTFLVPADWKPDLVPVVVWEDGSGGWRWLPTTVTSRGDRRTATTRTDHFSTGFLAGVDPSKLAADFATAMKNIFTGRSGVEDPTCQDTTRAKAKVRVSSDNGDAVKWCTGLQDEQPILKIANNRRTYTQLDLPKGWEITGRSWGISFDKLVRWGGEHLTEFASALPKDRQIVLIDPGETITIKLPTDAHETLLASGSGVAFLLQIFIQAFGMYLTVAKAAALVTTHQTGALTALLGSGNGSNTAWTQAGWNCLNQFADRFTDDLTKPIDGVDTLANVLTFGGQCALELGKASIADAGPLAWLISATVATAATVVTSALALGNALIVAVRELVDTILWPFGKQRPTYRITIRPATTSHPRPSPLTLSLGETATFENFRVTVDRLSPNSGTGLLIRAKVCVTKLPKNPQGNKTRISWDPWSVLSETRRAKAGVLDGHPPSDMFPQESLYEVGDCASGQIPFAALANSEPITSIRYANGVGNSATWLPGKSGQQEPATCSVSAFARDLKKPTKGMAYRHCTKGWALVDYPRALGDTGVIARAVSGRWTIVTGLPSDQCFDDLASLDPPDVFRPMLPCR